MKSYFENGRTAFWFEHKIVHIMRLHETNALHSPCSNSFFLSEKDSFEISEIVSAMTITLFYLLNV